MHPLLVHPTHYTGEEGYISDTEDTQVIHTGGAGQLSVAGNIVTDIYLLTILYWYSDAVEDASIDVSREKEEL